MLIPIGVDVPFDRRPFLNWLVILGCVAVFVSQIAVTVQDQSNHSAQQAPDIVAQEAPDLDTQDQIDLAMEKKIDRALEKHFGSMAKFVLRGFSISGLFGHMWLHGGLMHLIGNMLFLWVFGNAVCSKIGNVLYLPVYIMLGLAAAFTYIMFSDYPMIGASGAVNGIVGMYLIFFPLNDITCFWMFYFRGGTFSLSSFWMILFWLAFDILGVVGGGGAVAYTAHLGGFAAGIVIAVVLLKLQIVQMEDDERSLLQVFGINLAPKRKSKKREYVAPSGPREEAILRAAMDRKTADREESYEENDNEIGEQPAGQKLRFAYQQENYEDSPERVGLVDDGYIRFSCECGKKLKVPSSYAGKNGKCPKCGSRVLVPG